MIQSYTLAKVAILKIADNNVFFFSPKNKLYVEESLIIPVVKDDYHTCVIETPLIETWERPQSQE